MTERIRRRAIVRGDVQGVGFRWSTAIQAQRLGLAGEAVNRRDGTVEVVAEGDSAAVHTLLAWLQEGPPTARVDGVDVTEEDPTGEQGFRAG